MAVSNLEVRLSRWRESFHLIADPFKQYEADQERGFLPYCFVDRPYLHNILGDPKHPQTAFLSAASGEGKTATRQMVVYECQSGFLKGKALPVCYDSFEEFHDGSIGDLSQATLQHHINAISRRLFATLKTDVEPTFFDRLQPFDADLLLGLAETYASSVCKMWLQRVLPGATPLKGAAAGLSPAETLL
jgi:hypothetical protein